MFIALLNVACIHKWNSLVCYNELATKHVFLINWLTVSKSQHILRSHTILVTTCNRSQKAQRLKSCSSGLWHCHLVITAQCSKAMSGPHLKGKRRKFWFLKLRTWNCLKWQGLITRWHTVIHKTNGILSCTTEKTSPRVHRFWCSCDHASLIWNDVWDQLAGRVHYSAHGLLPGFPRLQPAHQVLKTICSNKQTCAPEDGHNDAQNMLS